MISLALMIIAMIRYAATTVAYVADYGTPCRVDMGNVGWTWLSCRRFVSNRVRVAMFVLAYNLENFLRQLCRPQSVKHWSLRSVQVKLIKTGDRLVRHAQRLIFQVSEVSVPAKLFLGVLDGIGRLSPAPN